MEALKMLPQLALLALTLAWSSVACGQRSGEDSAYQRTIDTALQEYEAGHYAEARGLFMHAHELEPSARTLRGLGMAEYELRHYARASELLEQALASPDKPLSDEQRASVRELLERTGLLIGRYRLEVEPNTFELELDGERVAASAELKLAVGEHTLRIAADGYAASNLHLDAKGGEQKELRVALQPLAGQPNPSSDELVPPVRVRPYRRAGIALSALGGAALVAGGVLGALALSNAHAAQTRDGADADSAKTLSVSADVALGVGVVSAAVGVVLLLWRKEQRQSRVDAGFDRLLVRF